MENVILELQRVLVSEGGKIREKEVSRKYCEKRFLICITGQIANAKRLKIQECL